MTDVCVGGTETAASTAASDVDAANEENEAPKYSEAEMVSLLQSGEIAAVW